MRSTIFEREEVTGMNETILTMRGITKYIFDSDGIALKNTNVKILEKIDFQLRHGEVHVLMGENGAGKSTLMKILGGIIPADEGEMILEGQPVTFKNPMEAKDAGIGFIHQELNLCQNIDVAHNMFMGNEIMKNKYFMDKKMMYQKSKELLMQIGCEINPKTIVRNLSTAQQQLVEIAKAMSYHSKILIMDEPTASLSQNEIDILFKLIQDMKSRGISIIYISHRFEELLEIGDSITVLRDGKNAGNMDVADYDYDKLVNMMVGRTLEKMHTCNHIPQDDEVLRVENLKISGKTLPLHISVKKGEIVGLGGLVGSGRTELAQSIYGARRFSSGEIYYMGRRIKKPNPRACVKMGIAYLSEDRKLDGLILPMDIRENISLAYLGEFFKNKIISKSKEREIAEVQVEELNIVCRSIYQLVNTLSGGNQQKVVLAKWLSKMPALLILDEPTRGIDINAKAEIYRLMDEIAGQGVAILMISSEMPELIGMSDRIYVMRGGTVSDEINKDEGITQERVLQGALN